MAISTITALMIQANEVQIVDTADRTEAWILHDGRPPALMLSCPIEHKAQLEKTVAEIKRGDFDMNWTCLNDEV